MAIDDEERQFDTLYPEFTEAKIAADWALWANEGRNPATDREEWTPTEEGTHWWVATRQAIREAARQYDLMGSEFVRAMLPQWSWGEYLDDHAELRSLARNMAVRATGAVTFTGTSGTVIASGAVVGVPPSAPDAVTPQYETTAAATIPGGGTISVPVRAVLAGLAGSVGPGAVTAIVTPTPGVTSVTNPAAIVGGADVENDLDLSERVVTSFTGSAVANQAYYRRLALSVPGIGRATVVPISGGTGTVTIIVSTVEGGAVSDTALAALQNLVDPASSGTGAAQGQVGASVTVVNAAALAVLVSATIEPTTGYSLDGTGGTIALRSKIARAIRLYVESLLPGEEVVLARVIGAIVGVSGVHDAGSVTINGAAQNLAISTSPPRAPIASTPTLTQGTV